MLGDGKTLVFSDMHFGIHGNSEKYLDVCSATMEWLAETCGGEKIRYAVFMGDYFDSRSAIDVRTLDRASDALLRLSGSVDRLFMVLGNHDIYLRDRSDISSLAAYRGIDSVTVVDRPMHENGCSMLPWGYGRAGSGHSVPRGTSRVFCHHDFPKSFFFSQRPQHAPLSGDTSTASRYGDVGIEDSIVKEVVANGGFVMSGHVHHPRTIPLDNGASIVICGSPYETEYGFGGAPCGAYILEGAHYEFVPNPHNKRHVEIRASSAEADMAGVDFPNSFVRLKVDVQMPFDAVSKLQREIASRNPYFVFNTVFDFESCPFAGSRDLDANPALPAPGAVATKLDYLNAAIDAADFTSCTYGDGAQVDRNVVKELAAKYYEKMGRR